MKKTVFAALLLFLVLGCVQPPDKNADKNITVPDQNKGIDINAPDKNQAADTNVIDKNLGRDVNAPSDQNIVTVRRNATLIVFVKDAQEKTVQNAKISIDSIVPRVPESRNGFTDVNGFILFSSMAESTYKVVVEKDGFITQTAEKMADANLQNVLNVKLEKAPLPYNLIKWKKILNDGSISISPAGFLLAKRGEKKLILQISPDFIGELQNKTFEWKLKIIESGSTGFGLSIELFTPSNKLIKVQHAIDRVNVVGTNIAKAEVNLKQDYRTFKLAVNSEGKATLFIDGKEAITSMGLSELVPVTEPKRLHFESFKGIVSIDYFYVDLDNDGKWDYQENWDTLENVS